jgi:hypothetical protein
MPTDAVEPVVYFPAIGPPESMQGRHRIFGWIFIGQAPMKLAVKEVGSQDGEYGPNKRR